jgi:hypothetical protein
LEDAEKDLFDMKFMRWQEKAMDKEWTFIIKEAKALRGPYSKE